MKSAYDKLMEEHLQLHKDFAEVKLQLLQMTQRWESMNRERIQAEHARSDLAHAGMVSGLKERGAV